MPEFDIHKIGSSAKTERQNDITLGYFSAIAFPDVAHEEIINTKGE